MPFKFLNSAGGVYDKALVGVWCKQVSTALGAIDGGFYAEAISEKLIMSL